MGEKPSLMCSVSVVFHPSAVSADFVLRVAMVVRRSRGAWRRAKVVDFGGVRLAFPVTPLLH